MGSASEEVSRLTKKLSEKEAGFRAQVEQLEQKVQTEVASRAELAKAAEAAAEKVAVQTKELGVKVKERDELEKQLGAAHDREATATDRLKEVSGRAHYRRRCCSPCFDLPSQ